MQLHSCFIRRPEFNQHFLYLLKQLNYSQNNYSSLTDHLGLFNLNLGPTNLNINQNKTDIVSINDEINSIADINDKLLDHFVQWIETKKNITKPHFFQ
jgi:hypothetical protein